MPLHRSDFQLSGQTSAYHGKVRDMYTLEDGRIVAVETITARGREYPVIN